jgi:hypothetical protein
MDQTTREPPLQERDTGAAEALPTVHEEEPAPVGTLFLMMLFLAAIVGLWGTLYWMLLSR